MAKIRMDQPVRWGDGTIASPRQLLDQGRGKVTTSKMVANTKAGFRVVTFVDRITDNDDVMEGVEVSGYVKGT